MSSLNSHGSVIVAKSLSLPHITIRKSLTILSYLICSLEAAIHPKVYGQLSPSWHSVDSLLQIPALMFLHRSAMQVSWPVLLLKSIREFMRFWVLRKKWVSLFFSSLVELFHCVLLEFFYFLERHIPMINCKGVQLMESLLLSSTGYMGWTRLASALTPTSHKVSMQWQNPQGT